MVEERGGDLIVCCLQPVLERGLGSPGFGSPVSDSTVQRSRVSDIGLYLIKGLLCKALKGGTQQRACTRDLL
jgi:hypothetical protein